MRCSLICFGFSRPLGNQTYGVVCAPLERAPRSSAKGPPHFKQKRGTTAQIRKHHVYELGQANACKSLLHKRSSLN